MTRPVYDPRAQRRAYLVLTLVTGSLVAAGASVAHADLTKIPEGAKTITFTGSRSACASVPDLTSASILAGEWLTLVNRTGANATLDTGQRDVAIADGQGAVVRLTAGTYTLRLVPDCLASIEAARPVTVEVLRPAAASGERPELAGPARDLTGRTGVGPSGVDPGADRVAARPSRTGDPGGAAGATAGGAAGAAQPGGPAGGLEQARLFDYGKPFDPRGSRLLALIAAVCVSGVTAAIIRAIVAQRTRSVVTG